MDEMKPLVLVIYSDQEKLAEAAANFLLAACGGKLSASAPINRGSRS